MGRPPGARLTDEERKARRNARDRARRAEQRAKAVADGTYKPPPGRLTDEQVEALMETQQAVARKLDLPPEVVAKLDKKALYLAYLEKGLRRSQAAERAGVSYSTVKYWRKSDDKFREEETEREEAHLDEIEDRLRNVVSDSATPTDMIRYLERRRPDVWAPKNKVEHEVKLHYDGSDEERRARIAELIRVHNLELPVVDAEVVSDKTVPALLPGSDQG